MLLCCDRLPVPIPGSHNIGQTTVLNHWTTSWSSKLTGSNCPCLQSLHTFLTSSGCKPSICVCRCMAMWTLSWHQHSRGTRYRTRCGRRPPPNTSRNSSSDFWQTVVARWRQRRLRLKTALSACQLLRAWLARLVTRAGHEPHARALLINDRSLRNNSSRGMRTVTSALWLPSDTQLYCISFAVRVLRQQYADFDVNVIAGRSYPATYSQEQM